MTLPDEPEAVRRLRVDVNAVAADLADRMQRDAISALMNGAEVDRSLSLDRADSVGSALRVLKAALVLADLLPVLRAFDAARSARDHSRTPEAQTSLAETTRDLLAAIRAAEEKLK